MSAMLDYIEWDEIKINFKLQEDHLKQIIDRYGPYLDLQKQQGVKPKIAKRSLALLELLLKDNEPTNKVSGIIDGVIRSMNYQLEKQSIYLEELHQSIQEKDNEILKLNKKIEAIEAQHESKLQQLEASLEDLEMNTLDSLIQVQRWIEQGILVKV